VTLHDEAIAHVTSHSIVESRRDQSERVRAADVAEPGSVEWLSAHEKRAEPQHANRRADPSQATDARKGATTSFTASAYWKFESIPLQHRVMRKTRRQRVRENGYRTIKMPPQIPGILSN
jgi:hypothetical protein